MQKHCYFFDLNVASFFKTFFQAKIFWACIWICYGLFYIPFVFSNNNRRKLKIWQRICWHFFPRFFSNCSTTSHFVRTLVLIWTTKPSGFTFSGVIKFLYNFITRATRKTNYLDIMSSIFFFLFFFLFFIFTSIYKCSSGNFQ